MVLKKINRDLKKIMPKNVKEHVYRIGFMLLVFTFLILIFSIVRRSFFDVIDPEKHIYFEIVFLLLIAVLAEVAVFYFKQQSVLTLMVLGILISPGFIGLSWSFLSSQGLNLPAHPPEIFQHEEVIQIFAQLGAIILLFKVGLHSKIEKIFTKENLWTALMGIVLPFFAGYIYAKFTGGSFVFSMFIGAALAATSVGVTVAILKELNVLHEKFSEVIIGAAIIDDILALLLLSVVTNLAEAQGNAVGSVATTFMIAAVFIAGAIMTGKYIISYLDSQEMGTKRFLISISFMLFFAYAAEFISLSAIVGAFLAGVILNKSRHYKQLEEQTFGLEMLFMPIFFISLGTMVDVTALVAYIIPILVISAIAILTKLIACGGVAFLSKMSVTESLIVGTGMVPRGEVALIIASIALTKGILPQAEYSIISAMALLTSFVVPSALSFLIKKHNAQ